MHRHTFAFLTAAALSVGLSQIASAADLPVKGPAYVKAPVALAYNWTGMYVGALAAYGWADAQHCQIGAAPQPCAPTFPITNMTGGQGGVTLGYNWQVTNWVWGIEGDWSWGKLSGSSVTTPAFGCGGAAGPLCENSINSIGTIRGRVGFAADRFLPYVTAGAAFSRLTANIAGGTALSSGDSTTKTNFVWGFGVEGVIAPQWTAKLEYLNVSAPGDFVYDSRPSCGAATRCFVSVKSINLIRLGLNFKFM
jgi:outer membrane immunogenic protein